MGILGRFKTLAAATLAVTVTAAGVFAQTGGVVTVGKAVPADYTSIQAAVNAAKPGQVIQILDTEVYEGQVTIDGRETSPWPGVTGGKNGITIRYTPPAGTAPNSNFARPTIRYRDTQNTSPKNYAETQILGELPGMAGNFETSGALRIIRAGGVTIDGIAIDGVSAYPFGAGGVWNGMYSHFHGNTAITLVVANDAVIRNCDIKNAYFGMYVKDRNLGGVFGNPNPDDHDVTIPLSGFGKTGSHLIEYNRVHNNSVGLFFESAWDLGSTVRYNLIYNNFHTAATKNALSSLGSSVNANDQNGGGILFKDTYLTPIAIYNNTFYNNAGNLQGNWQIGGQHLIFNNIFSKSNPSDNPSPGMTIDNMFPNRMHNCLFSADDMLFLSHNETSPDFLVPKWDHPDVIQYIKNQGWADAGIRNTDGTLADLGAIPSSGASTQATTARIKPVDVVKVSGRTATLDFSLNVQSGTFNNPKIKLLRWVSPLPDNTGSWAAGLTVIPASSISTITPPSAVLTAGGNKLNVTLPAALPATNMYGFFEMVVEGINASGNTVSSDVGFLPYRQHDDYSLNIEFFPLTGAMTAATRITEVNEADPVRMRVTALKGDAEFTDGPLSDVNFTLASNPAARMYSVSDDAPFTSVPTMAAPTATYAVYFTSAGNESITASGAYVDSATQAVAFLGAGSITVTSNVKLVYNAGENGAITGAKSQSVLPGASGETVVAVPDNGYSFIMWSDGVKTATRTDVDVTSNINVTAIFAVEGARVLLYVAGDGGSIRGSAAQVLTPGQSGTPVEAVADSGYVFVSWSDGSKNAARSDGSITSDVEITASFAKAYYLRYSAGANGTLRGSLAQSVAAGSSGTAVTAVPNAGYRFDSWSDGVKTAERTDADVSADISVTAIFGENKYILSYKADVKYGFIFVSNANNAVQEYTYRADPGSDGPNVMAIGNLDAGYTFYRWSDDVTTATRKDLNIQSDISVMAYFVDADGNVSVASGGRAIPNGGNAETVVVAPVVSVTGEFTAGPNPVGKSSGGIAFFWQGKRIKGGSLTVYDAAGNVVRKLGVKDNAVIGNQARRQVGSWDLKDSKGRLVSEGTYLVKGKIAAPGGKAEWVSAVVGVR